MSVGFPRLGLAIAAVAAIVLSAVQLQPPSLHGPEQHSGALTSLNWAGLAQAGGARAYDSVAGSWTVPAVSCASGETAYSIAWVGLDGYGSKTVEQAGTESSCNSGVPTYDTWFEIYPAPPVFIGSVPVGPGDQVSASIGYQRGGFAIRIDADGRSFTTFQQAPGATRSSAEYIVEAPIANGTVSGFARIHAVPFSQLSVNGGPADTGGFDVIDMVDGAGKLVARATPSGDGFTVRR